MNVARNFALFCVVFYAAFSFANGNTNRLTGCFVPLLKAMGKLSDDFQSNTPPSAPLNCYMITELATDIIKKTFHGEIRAKIADDADCLTEKFDLHRTIYDVIKARVIDESTTLDETEKQRQLTDARKELTDALEKIVIDCPTDKQKFINIFSYPLGIKNDTVEARQTEYCLAKYTVDNNILELGDPEVWNPHNINPESVDCDGIVAAAKIDCEREIRTLISAMPKVSQRLDCIMDVFKTGDTLNSFIALKVLVSVDVPDETKKLVGASHSINFSSFMRTAHATCTKNNISAK